MSLETLGSDIRYDVSSQFLFYLHELRCDGMRLTRQSSSSPDMLCNSKFSSASLASVKRLLSVWAKGELRALRTHMTRVLLKVVSALRSLLPSEKISVLRKTSRKDIVLFAREV